MRDSAARTEAENAKLKAEMQAQQDELARLRVRALPSPASYAQVWPCPLQLMLFPQLLRI